MDKLYYRIQLSRYALTISLFSLMSVFFAPVILPCIMAPVAILLAVFSKGAEPRMSPRARRACLIAWIALAANVAVLLLSLREISLILTDPVRRQQFDDLLYRSYGYRLEDVLPLIERFLPR